MNVTPYILTDGEKYLAFPSEKSACEYLRVSPCTVAHAYGNGNTCKGYKVIRATSERELYMDKRLWKIWASMHERCELKSHVNYDNYGGRGISVCDEWGDYLPFAKWARKNGYADNLTIDRINVDGDYDPCNCRWITMKEQQNNKRNNHIVEYNGKRYTISQLAEEFGIKKTTLKERLKSGWSVDDAVTKPIRLRTKGWRPSGARMNSSEFPNNCGEQTERSE